MNCHCQSNKSFEICCGPFLNSKTLPLTAEQLMRSRYSAFVESNIEYLEQTQTNTWSDSQREAVCKWSKESQWKGLEIISVSKGQIGDKTGVVEFKAYYNDADGSHVHHEVSDFIFEERWIFKIGEDK